MLTPRQAPTVALYCASQFTPPVELTGGIWYDETKEYDHNMVEGVRNVLL
jgi:DNA-directed RNA polymerase III subunit RPC6